MDAFYAAVEQRDFPQYRGKPIAVGGPGKRGVVATASYEARKFGIHSAQASRTARRLCPQLIFVEPRFEVYKAVSGQIRAIFRDYTDLIEPLSLDEAYLDVTTNKKGIRSATLIAREIKQRINATTHLTASAGISINKFIAKVASDMQKPDGLTVVPPPKVHDFLMDLPIEKFYGVGKVTAAKLKGLNIHKGHDLYRQDEVDLIRQFGKFGKYLYQVVRGLDDRPVKPSRVVKSIGAERTFENDIESLRNLDRQLASIAADVAKRLSRKKRAGKTVTLKVKYSDFTLKTRATSRTHPVSEAAELLKIAKQLLRSADLPRQPVRLLGISVSNFDADHRERVSECRQLTLEF